jgi:hypothetical protein
MTKTRIINNRVATRCTILFDNELYDMMKKKAKADGYKLYEYINNLMVKDTGFHGGDRLYITKEERKNGLFGKGIKHIPKDD